MEGYRAGAGDPAACDTYGESLCALPAARIRVRGCVGGCAIHHNADLTRRGTVAIRPGPTPACAGDRLRSKIHARSRANGDVGSSLPRATIDLNVRRDRG